MSSRARTLIALIFVLVGSTACVPIEPGSIWLTVTGERVTQEEVIENDIGHMVEANCIRDDLWFVTDYNTAARLRDITCTPFYGEDPATMAGPGER